MIPDELKSAVTDVPRIRAAARPLDRPVRDPLQRPARSGLLRRRAPDAPSRCVSTRGAGHAARRRPQHRHDPVHGRPPGRSRRPARRPATWPPPRRSSTRPAGWCGADGVRARDGQRLSTTIAVRPTSIDLLHLRQRGRRAARRVRHRARRGGARPDRRHDARPAALAQRLRHAAPGTAARSGPGQRRARVRDRHASPPRRTRPTPTRAASPHRSSTISSRDARDARPGTSGPRPTRASRTCIQDDVPYWPLWYDSRGERHLRAGAGARRATRPVASRYDWDVSSWRLGAARSSRRGPSSHQREPFGHVTTDLPRVHICASLRPFMGDPAPACMLRGPRQTGDPAIARQPGGDAPPLEVPR